MPARFSPPRGMRRTLSPTERFRRAADLVVAEQGDTIVLVSLEHGRRYRLDLVASQMWWSLGEELTVNAVAAWLRGKYPSSARTAEVDALQLLAALFEAGLIESLDRPKTTGV